jgi:DNA primase
MTVAEMESLLETLGIKSLGSRGDEIQAECPAHEERTGHKDRNPSWYINANHGAHICFSCGFKGNIYTLAAYLNGTLGDLETNETEVYTRLSSRLMKLLTPEEVKPDNDRVIVTESMLSAFVEPPKDALLSRGLTPQSAAYYGIVWDRIKSTWIIPVRDLHGALLGWQEKGHGTRYFNNYPKGMKKGQSVFAYNKYEGGDMIVVESPLDVARLYSLGITGGVATYGCAITDTQFNALRGADRIVFALDNDSAGISASKDMFQRCLQLNTDAWFFDYTDTDVKDIGGMSLPEIQSGLANAKHISRGEKAFL